jgi:hypothetical protein
MAADAKDEDETDKTTNPNPSTTPKLEDNAVAPPPREEAQPPRANSEGPKKAEPTTAKPESTPPATRPREVEPAKKKGKKGDDGPPG